MSHSGHFRAYGRRDVDLAAALDPPGETAEAPRGSHSSIEAVARPHGPNGPGARSRTSSSPAARSRSTPAGRPSESPSAKGPHIRLVNLSLGGACIEGATLAQGATVTVEILAPTLWDPLVLRGHVIWTKSGKGPRNRAGLSFEHDDPTRAFALLELLGAHDYDV